MAIVRSIARPYGHRRARLRLRLRSINSSRPAALRISSSVAEERPGPCRARRSSRWSMSMCGCSDSQRRLRPRWWCTTGPLRLGVSWS